MTTGLFVFMLAAVLSCAFTASPPFDPLQPNVDNIPQCMQPPQAGLCLAYIPSWYYNPSTKKCLNFIYGGCRGNLNRFFSEAECMRVCGDQTAEEVPKFELRPDPEEPKSEVSEDICSQPKQPGLCYAFFNRFFFNGEKCESFVYGGCNGNQNNFLTEEECNKACPPKVVEVLGQPKVEELPKIVETEVSKPEENVDKCSQPKQPGLCYAYFNRFFFNGEKCESFVYGGCGGNQNNFETEEECNKACPSKIVENFFPFRQGKRGKSTIKTV